MTLAIRIIGSAVVRAAYWLLYSASDICVVRSHAIVPKLSTHHTVAHTLVWAERTGNVKLNLALPNADRFTSFSSASPRAPSRYEASNAVASIPHATA